MLERVALHQTRLRTPGLGLDSKGVALGAKGVVLLPTIDRLVGLLAIYTRDRSLEDLLPSLELRFVHSALGTREITLAFAAESSDRMDRFAEIARLVGGFTFTGTSRHFVQYRDASAPFGYDAHELLSTEAPLALYHDQFSQTYAEDTAIRLRSLLLRLMPHANPKAAEEPGARTIVAEEGLGPALLNYLVRSRVEGEVTLGEWPPDSAFDDAPVRRYVLRVPDLPARMRRLMRSTPGLTTFLPAGPGVAVEVGYRHPVELRACPVFDPTGLVLIRGRGEEPWELPRVPPMGELRSFARVELRGESARGVSSSLSTSDPSAVKVPLRLVPSSAPWRNVTATWITTAQLPLLRRLAYALPRQTLATTRIALTDKGAFVRSPQGIEAIPLGTFFVELHPGLFTPAGFDVIPAVAADVLYRALAPPPGHVTFVTQGAAALAVPTEAFVELETALLEAQPWDRAVVQAIESALATAPIELKLTGVGLFPLAAVEPAPLEAGEPT